MSKAKFTPGPWSFEVGDDPECWADYFPTVHADGYQIIGTEGMYGDRETDIANARLIAAAPELLEALQKALNSNWTDFDWMDGARLAIAKATGEK